MAVIPVWLIAQDILTIRNGCNFSGEESEKTYYEFDASREADSVITEILNAVSLEKNFTIKSSNCSNALATTENGQRYILYNTTFLEQFKKDTRSRWAAYCVFAHEIGHHLQGHDFAQTDPLKRKKMELEADKFSGGVLRMLGACLEDAQSGVSSFALVGETATHPSGAARREAVASGWKKKDEQLGTPCGNTTKTPATPPAADLGNLKVGLNTDVAQYDDKLKNIAHFLKTGDLMFEYPQKMKEYNNYVGAYNTARDSAYKHRPTYTAQFKAGFARDENARQVLSDWYKTALDDIHVKYILALNEQVQQLFSDVQKEKISPSKARQLFRRTWSEDTVTYKAFQKSLADLEDLRKQLILLIKI
jgi:hypothetical protein